MQTARPPPSGGEGVPSRLHGSTCFGGRHHAPWARSAAFPRGGIGVEERQQRGDGGGAARHESEKPRRGAARHASGAGPCRGAACAGHRSDHRGGRRALRGVRAPPALHGDVGFPVRVARGAHGGALRRVVIPPGAPWRFTVAVGDPSGIPLRSGGGDSGASDAGRPARRRDAPRPPPPCCGSSPSPRRPAIRRASSSARRSGAPPGGAPAAAPDAPGPTEPRHPDGGVGSPPIRASWGGAGGPGRRRARPFPPRSPAACGDGGASPRAGSLRRRFLRRRAVGALMRAAPHGRRSSPMSPPPPRAMLRAYE